MFMSEQDSDNSDDYSNTNIHCCDQCKDQSEIYEKKRKTCDMKH